MKRTEEDEAWELFACLSMRRAWGKTDQIWDKIAAEDLAK